MNQTLEMQKMIMEIFSFVCHFVSFVWYGLGCVELCHGFEMCYVEQIINLVELFQIGICF
jgi:hypothetical protein